MSLFLTDDERTLVREHNRDRTHSNLFWGLVNRAKRHGRNPGLGSAGVTTDWWHYAAEYVTDAAFVCAVQPDDSLSQWLRHAALEIARRPVADWIGPEFRDHACSPARGHLETTHLAIAVAVALDLVPQLFSDEERRDLEAALREKAMPLCREWIRTNRHLANWRCILLAGLAVPAAVLDDADAIAEAAAEFRFCLDAIQPDGTYGESLQYSNYCYYGLMMTREALLRRDPFLDLPNHAYAKAVPWFVHSYLYRKPLGGGWGASPMPRSLNFNDSAAVFGADPDLLLHIAATRKDDLPREAGLARWLFDELYAENPAQGPFDRSSFGFVNRFGFLSVLHYAKAPVAIAPDALPPFAAFSNGQCVSRSSWKDSRTVVGFMASAPDGLHAPGHLHADLNSFILAHNGERLLADPGHTCYRSLIHRFDCATETHNTCTFTFQERDGLQEDVVKTSVLQQRTCPQRKIGADGQLQPPVPRGGRRLLAARADDVTVFANDAAEAYGAPITRFERFLILAGANALFVVDRVEASQPVRTVWNWLLNNRDGELDLKLVRPDRLVARRGNAGIKLFHAGGNASLGGPAYGYVHDAYHPLPGQLGEGAPGSGLLVHWTEREPRASRTVVHAAAIDAYGIVSGWHFRQPAPNVFALEGPGGTCRWELTIADNSFAITETIAGRTYSVAPDSTGNWSLNT